MKKLLIVLAAILSACGAEPKHSAGAQSPASTTPVGKKFSPISLAVADTGSLPACNSDSQGELVYVKASSQFQTCDAGNWSAISIQGKDGANGKDGTTNKINGSIHCDGELGTTNVWFDFVTDTLSSGDVFVTANIRGDVYQSTASNFYAASQAGASNPGVTIESDMEGSANAGYWDLSLDPKTLIVSIKYTDADGNLSYTMTPDKCQVHSY